jgi:MarR family transcriptional regulator, organic hydroperoxide resistance regulator
MTRPVSTVHGLLEKHSCSRYNVFTIKYLDYQDIISRRQILSRSSGNKKSKENERRKMLLEQLQFLGEVVNTETALFQHLAAAQYGLGITDMKTLSILLREGPMTAGDIGNRLRLTSGSVTTLIDRLERRDLVKRQPHANDRRKVIVTVNQEKLAGDDVYRSMGDAFARQLQTYSTAQLEFLVQFHETTLELTKKEIAKLARRGVES